MVAKAQRVIIDTDPGIDDAAAIWMALGSPEFQVDALPTVFGNTPVTRCTINALRILEAAQRTDIPVYKGVAKPYNGMVPGESPNATVALHVDAPRLTQLWVERLQSL